MDDMDMSMDSPGMFTGENEFRARVLWIVIGSFVGVLTLKRVYEVTRNWLRRRSKQAVPSNTTSTISTITAVLRELTYPQPIWFTGAISKYFTPPSTGRILLLSCYWIVILVLLWSDVILQPDDPMYPYKWEKVGFRAAWISVSQIPFIYLLSCKFNPISLLTGISYERFNWLHRWAARTVFLTIIVHWSFFFEEWVLADFVEFEFEMMPMVKYGFGAWAVIGWMVFSGFGFFRAVNYEFFVLQHICAAAVLLWLIYVHIPQYAMYNVWLSVGFIVFDWSIRLLVGIFRNVHLGNMPGYSAMVETLPGDMVRLTVDAGLKWRAGQHVYIWIPSLRPLELHPFTIADNVKTTFLIKAKKGLTKSLYKSAKTQRVFLSMPLGSPPDLSHFDTVLFVATSSGASFTVPMLQELVKRRGCIRQIVMHWMVREDEHVKWFDDALNEVMEEARRIDMQVKVVVHVTRFAVELERKELDMKEPCVHEDAVSTSSSSLRSEKTPFLMSSSRQELVTRRGRPDVKVCIRDAVESAIGETAVISCGGLAITAEIRTFIGQISDERAVHKGTGAQGIFLFTETYGW